MRIFLFAFRTGFLSMRRPRTALTGMFYTCRSPSARMWIISMRLRMLSFMRQSAPFLRDDQWNGNTSFDTGIYDVYGEGSFFVADFHDPRVAWLHERGSYNHKDFGHVSPYYGGLCPRRLVD